MTYAISAVLGGFGLRLIKRTRRRRQAVQLRNLCDAVLRDIGISPSMIDPATFEPVQPLRRNPHY
jgi:uncharacterized protein DUF1127